MQESILAQNFINHEKEKIKQQLLRDFQKNKLPDVKRIQTEYNLDLSKLPYREIGRNERLLELILLHR